MKKYFLALIPFVLGIGCLTTYSIIGSEVAADGTLVEPFFLIPIGELFVAIGILALAGIGIAALLKKTKKQVN